MNSQLLVKPFLVISLQSDGTADSKMPEPIIFQNYDDPKVYEEIQHELLDPKARNFVVEFGPTQAQIAYNLDSYSFEQLLSNDNPARESDRPVRWM